MFYGAHFTMSPPAKSRLKRQGQLLSSMLSRTLSYKYRDLDAASSGLGAGDDPAELSTQLSAPGVLKVFGDSVCSGTHYKSVLATATSSARELVREALERYALDPAHASQYVLCDAVGQAGDAGQPWQATCFRVFADNEKPLLIQEFWKPREGLSRRLELRKRSDVEELAAREVDTITAGINAQARRLQRLRAKGTALAERVPGSPRLRRSASETSLSAPGDGSDPGPGEKGRRGGAAHPALYQSPHLLLLQGYSQQHDSLVYALGREQHTVGRRTPSSRPSISLAAPDILPLHCTIRRRRLPGGEPPEDRLVLEPVPGAPVSVNFREVGRRSVALRHGDLLSLGLHYLLLFKDPAPARPLPAQTLACLRGGPQSCQACGALRGARGASSPQPGAALGPRAPRRRQLHLEFEPGVEDALLRKILTLAEPGGPAHQLAPAFLLCLCAQHAAACFEPGAFAQLLLKMAGMIRQAVWEKTKELAEKQAQLQEPLSSSSLSVADLAPDLQHVLLWMANAVEVLYFVQQRSPFYMRSLEEELDATGSKESVFSCALAACEEAMAVLEETILYAFQQCVYYISKALYVCLPVLLECPPFQTEPRGSWSRGPAGPEELRRVVAVYQATLDLLRQAQLHPEVASQLLAYLLFFSGTLLFNQLLDKGERFFRKLSCTLNLLATPTAQLIQMPWAALRARFPALSPAQLHRLLTQYQLAAAIGPVTAWDPGPQDSPDTFMSESVLESYENPPPIILPSEGFKVDLEADCPDDSVCQQLLHVRRFLWSLQAPQHDGGPPEGQRCSPASRDPGDLPEPRSRGPCQAQGPPGRPAGRVGSQPGPEPGDASCLLTPPGTPLGLEPGTQDWPLLLEEQRNRLGSPWGTAPEGDPSSRSSSPEGSGYVFAVELERGPSGLGLGLIDGMHTPLGVPGLYVQTLLPGSPAACDGRLSLGDCILEVNGASLRGLGYLRAVELIRHGGKKVRFLVAKSDVETAKKMCLRTPPS